ncbi:MAG: hypothetical protein ACREOD_04400 [Candidatus Dormibacteria bacterium]
MFVDRTGGYLDHDDRSASFRCAECQTLAIDLAEAARAAAREDRSAPTPTLRCPGCGLRMLPPEEVQAGGDELACPECGLIFSLEEGSPSLLGESSPETDQL